MTLIERIKVSKDQPFDPVRCKRKKDETPIAVESVVCPCLRNPGLRSGFCPPSPPTAVFHFGGELIHRSGMPNLISLSSVQQMKAMSKP
jgi:hypothetical protein